MPHVAGGTEFVTAWNFVDEVVHIVAPAWSLHPPTRSHVDRTTVQDRKVLPVSTELQSRGRNVDDHTVLRIGQGHSILETDAFGMRLLRIQGLS